MVRGDLCLWGYLDGDGVIFPVLVLLLLSDGGVVSKPFLRYADLLSLILRKGDGGLVGSDVIFETFLFYYGLRR